MTALRVFRLSDTLLEVGAVRPLTDVDTGDVIEAANTATATVHKLADGTQLGGTFTLTHDTGGRWRTTIDDDTAGMLEDLAVLIKLTIDAGAGLQLYAELKGIVRVADEVDLA